MRLVPQWQSRDQSQFCPLSALLTSPLFFHPSYRKGEIANLSPRQPEEGGWHSEHAAHLGYLCTLVSWEEAWAGVEAAMSTFQMDFPGCLRGESSCDLDSPNSESLEQWRLLVRLLTKKKRFYAIYIFFL